MPEAHKTLATRWPVHLSTCHLGTCYWSLGGLTLCMLLTIVTSIKDTHISIDVDRLLVLFYTVRQFPPNYLLHRLCQQKTFLSKHKTVQCNVAKLHHNYTLCVCKRFETVARQCSFCLQVFPLRCGKSSWLCRFWSLHVLHSPTQISLVQVRGSRHQQSDT